MKVSLGAKTIVFPTPVFVIGSYDAEGKPNAMTASWAGICSSEPPCVCVSLREATYTFGNIMNRKAFTISIPSVAHVKEADYLGLASGRNEDKFAKTGLTPVKSTLVDAPYVGEFPFVVECELFKTVNLGLHTQFVGKVVDVKADQTSLNASGMPEVEKLRPLMFDPANRLYHEAGRAAGKAFSIGRI